MKPYACPVLKSDSYVVSRVLSVVGEREAQQAGRKVAGDVFALIQDVYGCSSSWYNTHIPLLEIYIEVNDAYCRDCCSYSCRSSVVLGIQRVIRMNIRDKIKRLREDRLADQKKHKAERERFYREKRRKFWIRFIKIQSPLWVVLAIELIALWYVKTH